MKCIIRERKLKDCKDWINVNVSSWNDNLKGVVSDRLLKIISSNKEERITKEEESFVKDDNHYVLEEDNRVIGILKIKKSSRNGYEDCGEIQILYLLSSCKGNGYGKKLLNFAFDKLKEKGFNKIVIGCLENNSSNEFYKHMGGKFIKQEPWDIFDEHYIENLYLYEL